MVTKATNSVLNLVNPPIDQIVLTIPLAPSSGGTGLSTLLAKAVMIGNGISGVQMASIPTGSVVVGDQIGLGIAGVAPSAPGYALLSNGVGIAPSFQQITASIITGILGVPQGGTGKATFGVGNLLVGNGTSGLLEVDTAVSNLGYPLISQGEGVAPTYANLNAAFLVGTLGVPTGGTGQTTLGLNSVLIGNGTGGVIWAAPGVLGAPLLTNAPGSPPSFGPLNLAAPGVITGRLHAARAPVSLFGVYGAYGDYTYQVLPEVYALYVEVCGGGGGGAGENTGGPYTGGGGGAGGYAAGWISVVPGEIVVLHVGLGGTYGPGTSVGSGNGTNGGSTTFSASGGSISAGGGIGGKSSINTAGGDGGLGFGAGGAITLRGGYGSDGDATGGQSFGGNGGASFFGGGLRGGAGGPPGSPAASGSGGGGGYSGAASGGSGMDGIIILRG